MGRILTGASVSLDGYITGRIETISDCRGRALTNR